MKKPEMKKSEELFVTHKFVSEIKSELKHEMTSLSLEIRAVDKKVDALDKRVDALEKKMDQKFLEIDAKLERMMSMIHSIKVLVEQQATQNRFVLDGILALQDAQMETNQRLSRLEQHVFGIPSR